MTIHLRTIEEENGDVADYHWFCSQTCYAADLAENPPTETYEEGGAYPCGAEHDLPDYCARCGNPVGNPLTDYGVDYVRELLTEETTPDAVRTELLATYPDTLTSR